jgi:hypothetical protein
MKYSQRKKGNIVTVLMVSEAAMDIAADKD